jgi:surface protein
MKSTIFALLLFIVFPSLIDAQEFTMTNGTVFCDGTEPGDTGTVDGITYEAVDRQMLDHKITSGEDLTKVCTSLVTYMGNLFAGNEDFNQDIGSWDVSNVQEMTFMFSGALSFNQDISNWDVSNVMDMAGMFIETHNFNQEIGAWDVSSVRDMSHMFKVSQAFNQDISDWDVSNVLHMGWMFKSSNAFNQDIAEWNVSSVNNMLGMFSEAKAFDQDLSAWCVDNFDSEPDNFRSGGSSLSENNTPNWGSCEGKPEPIVIEFPQYQEENVSTTPTFVWRSVENIDHYQFRLLYGDLPYQIDTLLSDTTFSLIYELELNEFYYWQVRAINGNASGEWSDPTFFTPTIHVSNENSSNPKGFSLHQNYPNPFNPSTEISYYLPISTTVNVRVFDMLGREVAILVDGQQASGNHSITFNGSDVSSGMYFYSLQTGEYTQTKKMLLVK